MAGVPEFFVTGWPERYADEGMMTFERDAAAHAAENPEQSPLLPDARAGVMWYYMGDGLGMNLHLLLMSGGRYSMRWYGCMGLYGMEVGRWRHEGDRLVLDRQAANGMLARKVRTPLEVHAKDGGPVLVMPESREMFDRYGVNRFTCFQSAKALALD